MDAEFTNPAQARASRRMARWLLVISACAVLMGGLRLRAWLFFVPDPKTKAPASTWSHSWTRIWVFNAVAPRPTL